MFKHILIPTDGSDLSQKAVEQAVALAKSTNARVTALTVTIPFHVFALDPDTITATQEQYEERTDRLAAKSLKQATDAAKAAGVACDAVHVQHDQPYRAIIDAALARGCDLIAMASHGRRGMSALVLGSETVKVLTHSSIPVLVFRTPPPTPLGLT